MTIEPKSDPLAEPNKRIVICCDGTWNEPEEASEDEKDRTEPTNVLKFVRAVSPVGDSGIAQVVYYDPGVGTRWGLDRYIGGGLGTGLSRNVQEAYRFVANNYREGDHLFLLGFSRGAYTVRSLAGFIGAVGLLAKHHLAFAADAYDLYRLPPEDRAASPVRRRLAPLEFLAGDRVPIEFIGVWDTVGALGAPTPVLGRMTKQEVGFHDTQLGDNVRNAYHALAIDERRRPFQPDLWTARGRNTKALVQAWFPGVHSNVGSGYRETALSSLALNWMMHRAREHGLRYLPYATKRILGLSEGALANRARTGLMMDSFGWGYELLRAARVPPYPREIGPDQFGDIRRSGMDVPGEVLHRSALDRLGLNAPFGTPDARAVYQPENLVRASGSLPVFEYDSPAAPA